MADLPAQFLYYFNALNGMTAYLWWGSGPFKVRGRNVCSILLIQSHQGGAEASLDHLQ